MENQPSETIGKQVLKENYLKQLETYFLQSVIFDRLPKQEQDIAEYFEKRDEIELGYFPYLVAYASAVVGGHLWGLNRIVGKGLLFSKAFYYGASVFVCNGMIKYLVYEKEMKPHTLQLSRKYEGLLLEMYPGLMTIKKNCRLNEEDFKE